MSEVEISAKARDICYSRLTDEQKQIMNNQEDLIDTVRFENEKSSMITRFKDANPMFILDMMSTIGAGITVLTDKIYEQLPGDVPNYIKQETRSLLYSDEGNLKKLGSMVLYNTDSLVATAATMALADLPIKGINKAIDKLTGLADK